MMNLPQPCLIGVIHLPALPGAVLHRMDMEEIVRRSVTDATTLKEAGFDALVVENYGDRPFSPGGLQPATVAALAVAADQIRRITALPLGINALRNDARSALGVAAAVGAGFIRVNVHTGVYATDQGMIEGRANETLAYRKQLGARIAILADVNVKHATPIGETDLARNAADAAYRGLADGLVVTGPATGEPVLLEDLRRVRAAVPDRRVFVGSGATTENVRILLQESSGIIVGTGIKVDGVTENPVDFDRACAFVRAAGR
jgi:membrane complex biogenesis BtpA family protein